ncbi:MAG: hypothetical protein WC444_04515 [Candidatus Paceibacterota bacterium]
MTILQLQELHGALLEACITMKRVLCGVKFEGVFQNEVSRPLAAVSKQLFVVKKLIEEANNVGGKQQF